MLVAATHRAAVGLSDDRHDRDVVELGVVEPVEEVNRARSGGRDTDRDLPGELRVADGLEGGHLLVPRLDERGFVVGPAPRGKQAVDAVTGIAEDDLDAPVPQPPQNVVGDSLSHQEPPRLGAAVAKRSKGQGAPP